MGIKPEKELQARRLIAQGLAGSNARNQLDSPQAVAEHLLAVQGQTYKAGIHAIALRINNGKSAEDTEVLEAVARHEIVRAWPMRGTLHFMNATDARWLMRLCSPRVESGAAKRRPALGFKEGDYEKARDALNTHLLELGDGEYMERKAIYRFFDQLGIDAQDGRGPHLMRAFGGLGDVVQGVPNGRNETFVHIDRLAVTQRELEADAALAELGNRYAHGHGPVRVEDLAWWAYLTKAMAKKALTSAPDVTTLIIGDTEYFVPSWQLDVTEAEMRSALRRTYHLPAFDEYLLGYSDKSFTMADEIRHEVLTKNGISWDFTVKNGSVVGRTQ